MNNPVTPLIRDFTAQDLTPVLRLQEASFPEELRADGYTAADSEREARTLVVGNMLPFKVLMWFMQRRWALLVAEVAGQVVGMGGFQGSDQAVEFGPLMVLPEYRRQGIGAALTRARMARAAQMGVVGAYVGPLSTNIASLENLKKNGFATYRYLTGYEVVLPWSEKNFEADLAVRPAQAGDKLRVKEFETRAFGPERLTWEGSRLNIFCPGWAQRVYRRLLAKRDVVALIAERDGRIVATAEISTNAHTSKGHVRLERDPNIESAPADFLLLDYAAKWLTYRGKNAMRVFVPGQISPPAFASVEHRYCWVYMSRRLE